MISKLKQYSIVIFAIIVLCFSIFILPVKADTNLAPFPTGWLEDHTWGQVPTGQVSHDTSTTHSGSYTLKITPSGSPNAFDAFDFWAVDISPGDRVVIKCWIKTSGSGYSWMEGAFFGLDWYTPGGDKRIGGAGTEYQAAVGIGWSPYHAAPDDQDVNFVHWGTDWTQITWDFIVPSLVEGDGILRNPDGSLDTVHQVQENTWVEAGLFVPWCEVFSWSYPSNAYPAWFSGMEIYVNPTGTPTPSASPTPHPSATPSPTPVPLNSINFNFRDLSNNFVTSGVTWQIYSGTTPVTYTMGAHTLASGTYTLKTYYYGQLVNITSFSAVAYNGRTLSTTLNLKQGSYFNIATDKPLTSLVINSENATSLSFSATGSSGPYTIVIPTSNNALFLNLNGVAQAYGSGWAYDSVNHCVVITAISLPAS